MEFPSHGQRMGGGLAHSVAPPTTAVTASDLGACLCCGPEVPLLHAVCAPARHIWVSASSPVWVCVSCRGHTSAVCLGVPCPPAGEARVSVRCQKLWGVTWESLFCAWVVVCACTVSLT